MKVEIRVRGLFHALREVQTKQREFSTFLGLDASVPVFADLIRSIEDLICEAFEVEHDLVGQFWALDTEEDIDRALAYLFELAQLCSSQKNKEVDSESFRKIYLMLYNKYVQGLA